MAGLFIESGVLALAAFISPFRADRERIKTIVGPENFFEIYCRCPFEICEQRDVKGFYQKARQGIIAEFTGISSPYEEPASPDLIIDTSLTSLDESVRQVLSLTRLQRVLPSDFCVGHD
jgi:adenylylsulfate kinase